MAMNKYKGECVELPKIYEKLTQEQVDALIDRVYREEREELERQINPFKEPK